MDFFQNISLDVHDLDVFWISSRASLKACCISASSCFDLSMSSSSTCSYSKEYHNVFRAMNVVDARRKVWKSGYLKSRNVGFLGSGS